MSWSDTLSLPNDASSRTWSNNNDLIRSIAETALDQGALLRVAALASVEGRPHCILVRQGERSAREQMLDRGFGFPRGKLSWSALKTIAKSPKEAEEVLHEALLEELEEECALRPRACSGLRAGPLVLMKPSYSVTCAAESLRSLGYPVDSKRITGNKRKQVTLAAIATFHFVLRIDAKAWEKRTRALASTEGRVTGLIDVRQSNALNMLRMRPRLVAREYRQQLDTQAAFDQLIDLGL